MRTLVGKVAVVCGASRGVGRGIALALGEAGATVYVTGRSSLTGRTIGGRPETIEETVEMVKARGGNGIPVRCDHTVESEVELLFDRVSRDHGQLDILVNNVWGGYEDMGSFGAGFWDQPVSRWDAMITRGAKAHFLASKYAAPLMFKGHGGLVVGTTYFSEGHKIGSVLYDVAKSAINRLAWAMAQELRAHGITSVAISPGFVRTEKVLEQFSVMDQNWATVKRLENTESPEYIGRAVVALASDPAAINKTGEVLYVGELAQEYGFTDTDGRQPAPYQH